MTWPPNDFFLSAETVSAGRPVGQGDVFRDVPIGKMAKLVDGEARGKTKKFPMAMVVASSCGMRKGAENALSDAVQVAPVTPIASLVPGGWNDPWDPTDHMYALPLPGLDGGEALALNIAQIGLTSKESLALDNRIASVDRPGMAALKERLATYFVRHQIPAGALEVGAAEEWYELNLWEAWVEKHGSEAGFQAWLEESNTPDFPDRTRREMLFEDYEGLMEQVKA